MPTRSYAVDDDEDEYEYYDDDDIDEGSPFDSVEFSELDHPIVEIMNDNLYKYLKLSPMMSNDASQAETWQFLQDTYSDCINQEDLGMDNVQNMYIQILETMFIKVVEDLNFVLRMFIPHTLVGAGGAGYSQPLHKSTLEKIIFNTLFPLESSGYSYPQGDPYKSMVNGSYTAGPDSAFRGSWDIDHDGAMEVRDIIPDSWQRSLKEYIERTVIYLYGEPDEEESVDQPDTSLIESLVQYFH